MRSTGRSVQCRRRVPQTRQRLRGEESRRAARDELRGADDDRHVRAAHGEGGVSTSSEGRAARSRRRPPRARSARGGRSLDEQRGTSCEEQTTTATCAQRTGREESRRAARDELRGADDDRHVRAAHGEGGVSTSSEGRAARNRRPSPARRWHGIETTGSTPSRPRASTSSAAMASAGLRQAQPPSRPRASTRSAIIATQGFDKLSHHHGLRTSTSSATMASAGLRQAQPPPRPEGFDRLSHHGARASTGSATTDWASAPRPVRRSPGWVQSCT
jgi:hypothetical protein